MSTFAPKARLSPGRARVTALALLGFALNLAAACGTTSSGPASAAPRVDPQVMQDVIAATFMAPGPEMLRAMRIREFARNLAIEECGGQPSPIDGTSNRWDQAHFPYLELIRDRGFTEVAEANAQDRRLEAIGKDCNDLTPNFASAEKWFAVTFSWIDVVQTAVHDPSLEASKGPMTTCLTRRTGLHVTADDPAVSYVKAATYAASDDATTPTELKGMAVAYADCSKDYFAELRTLLVKQRPAAVERNREVIEQFASSLVKAGYVP